ncbi:YgiW/YdeI family stress tolerance OB fold protein [Variovorax sp. KK3]|uniref:YgiW/YdeI family stress tolerance OB fold protein n=1 Tax=Variovorax sp. KK3 TaxID=1855728 RepID=UPI00097BCE00|nr:NirD/YgiW/YdeI family stress tolerance protein [Variovorax sp. KK3]
MASHSARNTALCIVVAAFAALSSAHAVAQGQAAPVASYTGPTSIPVTSVNDLLSKGQDDQYAVLRGRIVSHDGGKDYTFDDGSGRINVEIKQKHFPTQQTIDDKTEVELVGKLDKDFRKKEFEVDQLRVR